MIKKHQFIFHIKILVSIIGGLFVFHYAILRPAEIAKKKNIANVEAVKEGLEKGYNECKERWENKQSTKFTDIPSFFAKYDGFEIKQNPSTKIKKIRRRFEREKIKESISENSCFEAKAIPLSDKHTWFKYVITEYDTKEYSGLVIWGMRGVNKFKGLRAEFTCGDPLKTGCRDGNKWSY